VGIADRINKIYMFFYTLTILFRDIIINESGEKILIRNSTSYQPPALNFFLIYSLRSSIEITNLSIWTRATKSVLTFVPIIRDLLAEQIHHSRSTLVKVYGCVPVVKVSFTLFSVPAAHFLTMIEVFYVFQVTCRKISTN
jgi:hypothetical protein